MSSSYKYGEVEHSFRQLFRKMTAEWKKHLELSGSHAFILEKLATDGPQKVSELAEALDVTLGGVTGLSDKLIAEGYAKRKRTEDDRRVVFLQITDKGMNVLHLYRERRNQILEILFQGLSDDDIQHLIRIHQQIITNIETNKKESTQSDGTS